jgi:TRAP-type uncharacterized transport system substrate-binding protein
MSVMDGKFVESVLSSVTEWTRNRVWAILVLLSLAAVAGCWWWSLRTRQYELRLASSVELKYRSNMISALQEEALERHLTLVLQSHARSADAIRLVSSGQLDAAVVPAGLAIAAENVRQVAIFDCEPLHLFVKPDLMESGLAGLRGRRVNLGASDSGVRIIATEVLGFAGLKAGEDYLEEGYGYRELIAMQPEEMPDAIFSLCPLPSPLGEWLVHEHGYQLMELPFGAAMSLRKAYMEDATIPANTYGVQPAVPEKPLHTIGTHGVLVANADVPTVAIRRLLEVFYESDFARRVGIPALNENMLKQSGEYPNHSGTVAYLHRHDPWVNKDMMDDVTRLRGLLVSAVSALILGWQWYRRRSKGDLNEHLRVCTRLELEILRCAAKGELDAAQAGEFQSQLWQLQLSLLEDHHHGNLPGDQAYLSALARIESLQQRLPGLISMPATDDRSADPRREAA